MYWVSQIGTVYLCDTVWQQSDFHTTLHDPFAASPQGFHQTPANSDLSNFVMAKCPLLIIMTVVVVTTFQFSMHKFFSEGHLIFFSYKKPQSLIIHTLILWYMSELLDYESLHERRQKWQQINECSFTVIHNKTAGGRAEAVSYSSLTFSLMYFLKSFTYFVVFSDLIHLLFSQGKCFIDHS